MNLSNLFQSLFTQAAGVGGLSQKTPQTFNLFKTISTEIVGMIPLDRVNASLPNNIEKTGFDRTC